MTSGSWDSYTDTLLNVLDEFKPKTVLEYGPGKSTKIMAMYPSVELINSVEHDKDFYQSLNGINALGVNLTLIEDLDLYSKFTGNLLCYDLAFVDGRNRVACLKTAKLISPLCILHDAGREKYSEGINLFTYKVWTDEGHTVTLTDSPAIHKRLVNCLSSVQNTIGVKS